MGKKRRRHPSLEELVSRSWCYYCERDFEDLKLLISHQKAKHFKCDRCGRRLNTAGGLSVHMNQVHKETLSNVENALPNRQGLEVEIFGMEGIPEEIAHQHNQRIVQNYYQAQADRETATGNPPSGAGASHSRKKLRFETPQELKARLRDYVVRRLADRSVAPSDQRDVQSPGQGSLPFAGQAGYSAATPGTAPSQYPPAGGAPPGTYSGFPSTNLPARPTGNNAPPGLPQRPQQQQYGSNYWAASSGGGGATATATAAAGASTVDELVGGAARQGGGDNIDHIIRMAEAGIKPPGKAADEAAPTTEKKKRDKNRMVFADTGRCPEEILSVRSS